MKGIRIMKKWRALSPCPRLGGFTFKDFMFFMVKSRCVWQTARLDSSSCQALVPATGLCNPVDKDVDLNHPRISARAIIEFEGNMLLSSYRDQGSAGEKLHHLKC